MKTIQMKEIVIDLTKSDPRSGRTTFARYLYSLFKHHQIEVEYSFSEEVNNSFTKEKLKETYSNNYTIELSTILGYCKKNKIAIKIIPE